MQTRPNSPDLCQHTCAYPSPQPLTGLTLAPRADAFNNVLPPPLPQMRDGRGFLMPVPWHLRSSLHFCAVNLSHLRLFFHLHPITLCRVPHPVSAPHPCAPTSTSIPSALHQFPSLFSATTPPCHVPVSALLHHSPQTRAEGFFL